VICSTLICVAFAAGWFVGGWQVQRNWSKLTMKLLELAEFWRQPIEKLPPIPMGEPAKK
jgi:hypothetical protein